MKNSRNIPDDVYQYDISHTKDDLTSSILIYLKHSSVQTRKEYCQYLRDKN